MLKSILKHIQSIYTGVCVWCVLWVWLVLYCRYSCEEEGHTVIVIVTVIASAVTLEFNRWKTHHISSFSSHYFSFLSAREIQWRCRSKCWTRRPAQNAMQLYDAELVMNEMMRVTPLMEIFSLKALEAGVWAECTDKEVRTLNRVKH